MQESDAKILTKMAQNHAKQTGNSKEILRIIKNIWDSFLKIS